MNRHPKNKTTKAENTKLYSLLIPLTLAWSALAASTPKGKSKSSECLTIHAGRALKSLCKRKPMITTKGRTMNRLTELKQKTPSFGLRKRRSRQVSARGLASCGWISGSCFVRRAYEQTNVGLQPVIGQQLKEAVKKKTLPPPKPKPNPRYRRMERAIEPRAIDPVKMSTFVLRKVNVNETKTRLRRVILPLLVLSTLFLAAGCEDYYSSTPGYYRPAYYGEGSVVVADGDRRYYRGPGYWYGSVYYVWTPGHWAWRTGVSAPGRGTLPNPGQLLWIHGHYIARG